MFAGIRKLIFAMVWLILFILAMVGVADNSARVALTYLDFSTPEWPLAWWIIISFVTGSFVGYLFTLGPVVRSKLAVRRSRKQLDHRESELKGLKDSADSADP